MCACGSCMARFDIVLGSVFGSILKLFAQRVWNLPRSWTGWRGRGKMPTTLPLCTPPSIRNENNYTTSIARLRLKRFPSSADPTARRRVRELLFFLSLHTSKCPAASWSASCLSVSQPTSQRPSLHTPVSMGLARGSLDCRQIQPAQLFTYSSRIASRTFQTIDDQITARLHDLCKNNWNAIPWSPCNIEQTHWPSPTQCVGLKLMWSFIMITHHNTTLRVLVV